MAKKVGVSKTAFNYWVKKFPYLSYGNIAKNLNTTPGELLKEVEEMADVL